MLYAPVIIPTLNRDVHLKRCLESLEKSPLAKETEVYISVDYPPSDKYRDGYEKVKKYLESKGDGQFKKVHVFYQDENIGAEKNIYFLMEQSKKTSDKYYILTEDDNEFSPAFLGFINQGLQLFEENREVEKICGYSEAGAPKLNDSNVYFWDHSCAWGFGTWRERRVKCDEWITRENFLTVFRDDKKCGELYKKNKKHYWILVEAVIIDPNDRKSAFNSSRRTGELRSMDFTQEIYMSMNNVWCVYPEKNLVYNWGFDGTGENCSTNEQGFEGSEIYKDDVYDIVIKDSTVVPTEAIREAESSEYHDKRAKKARFLRRVALMFGLSAARKADHLIMYAKHKKWQIGQKFHRQ